MAFVQSVLASLIAALLLYYLLFLLSKAKTRVDQVVDLTKRIITFREKNSYTGPLRNEFRYSLGVVMDELVKSFKTSQEFKEDGPWPCLVDFDEKQSNSKLQGYDLWNRFNKHVRPVIDDIDTHSLLCWLKVTQRTRQLNGLIRLCRQLESVVAKFDAAYQQGLVDLNQDNEVVLRDNQNPLAQALRVEYRKLHEDWKNWLRVSKSLLLINYIF